MIPIRFAVLFLSFALGGCSAGGGGTLGDVATPVVDCITVHGGDCVTPEAFTESAAARVDAYRSVDGFRNQWGLEHVKADVAYSHLELLQGPEAEPGAGVTLGFVDTGIDPDHPAFAGKTVTEEFVPGAVDETGIYDISHGTAVASVAAGARLAHPDAAHGVAWGADIVMFSVTLGSSDDTYRPIQAEGLAAVDAENAALSEQVLSWRDGARKVDILNLSFGYRGLIDRYTEQELRASYGATIAALAQADAAEKVILVWAAGNSHGDACDPSDSGYCRDQTLDAVSPGILAGLPAFIEELRGHSIAVAALSPAGGEIASFSNRCGIAADFCIAAPGDEVRFAYFGPNQGEVFRGVATGGGTSLAAPMVAGGLALMKQIFRGQLSNTELVARLFATADKSGVYADTAVYGQGSMDLGAATSPVGVLEVPGGGAGRSGSLLSAMSLRPGMAFGDGLQRSLASRRIMALDALGAPFWYRLGSFTTAAGGPSVTARLRGLLASASGPGWADAAGGNTVAGDAAGPERRTVPVSLDAALVEATAAARGSHMALAEGAVQATLAGRGGLSAAAFTTKGIQGRTPAVGAALGWRRPGSPLGLRAGWIGERETLLGSAGEGAFGTLAGDTSFVGVDVRTDLGGWRVGANAELGLVSPAARGGLVTRVSSLATSAFALHATRALAGSGALRLSLSQPLRVERGRASLTVPAGRTKAGAVLYDPVPAGLAPGGRQMDVAGQWRRPLAEGELRLGTVLSLRPGHRKTADPELTFLAGWRAEF